MKASGSASPTPVLIRSAWTLRAANLPGPVLRNRRLRRSRVGSRSRDLQTGFVPFDLTRGGTLFSLQERANINQAAAYVQDTLTLGALSLNGGVRLDRYNGLSQASCHRASRGRVLPGEANRYRTAGGLSPDTFETPYNENLLLSSSGSRRAGYQCLRSLYRRADAAGTPQPVQRGAAAARSQIPAGGCGLFLEVHGLRLRFRHPVEHADNFPDLVAQVQDRRSGASGSARRTCTDSRRSPPSATPAPASSARPMAASSSIPRWILGVSHRP